MDFIEFLKDKWAIIAGFFLAAVWIGANQQKLEETINKQRSHEEYHKELVTVSSCSEQRKAIGGQFDAGEKQFDEIKDAIRSLHDKSDRRHDDVMRALSSISRGGGI